MRAIACLLAVLFCGCLTKLQTKFQDRRNKSDLGVPAAPAGQSFCTSTKDPQKLDQGLQSSAPLPPGIAITGKAYAIAWARSEAIESPDEDPLNKDSPTPASTPEMGPLQVAKLSANAKKASNVKRVTNERNGTKELELSVVGSSYSYFFEDEQGVHFLQQTESGKETGVTFDVRFGRAPSLANTKSGLFASWVSSCGDGGLISIFKVPSKDLNLSTALPQPAPGIICDGTSVPLVSDGNNKIALAWLIKGPPDKKGKPTNNQMVLIFGDAEKGTFSDPIPLTLENNPVAGPVIAFRGEELALTWLVQGGAIGFAVVKPDTTFSVAFTVQPRLVPGSSQAKSLSPNIVVDNLYYGLAWADSSSVHFGLLDPKGEMPTAPFHAGVGEHPTIAAGLAAKEYGLFYWRPEDALISTKALVYQKMSCEQKKPKKTKQKPAK